ncbi:MULTISPECIES: DUF1579 family protein [Rhodanobacter]|jgi:hypothetical protein|uniref:DUF1579 domain-containing protein n=1 Tax=Rhodanobacter glycinis TaxID=582702 RepID=A0A1I4FZC3_9GAMM|nr:MULTISPECIES: DUF1579 family protein [Rhodanobacter]EIL95424.1 hypothetical protein UU5_11345 [Rhodanobacter sp. 115]SFL22166.1 Protein of unknown function [Rhodanobacter glycinis]
MSTTMTDNALALLAGEWLGEETIATTRWGQGGPASARVSARFDLGHRVLLQDYREERGGQPALQVHAVFAAGPEHDQYGLYWFDSYGFTPTQPALGHWDGRRLVFLRSSSRGQTRHIYESLDEDSYRLTLESSFDGGIHWEPVMQGTYRRIA